MKRLALCIGNQDYEILPKLSCAVADAVSMEEALKELMNIMILNIMIFLVKLFYRLNIICIFFKEIY